MGSKKRNNHALAFMYTPAYIPPKRKRDIRGQCKQLKRKSGTRCMYLSNQNYETWCKATKRAVH